MRKALIVAENLFWQLALVYLLLQILRWSLNDFRIAVN